MKTTIIKIFIVLCCHSFDGERYHYEVKNMENPEETGDFFTKAEYNEGDTIKVNFNDFNR